MADTSSFRDRFAAALRGWSLPGALAFLLIAAGVAVFMPIASVLVLLWVWLSKTPWSAIGYVRPQSWFGGALAGILLGVALKLAMKAVVMPLLGADPVNHAFAYLTGNLNALLFFAAYAVIGAGFAEETVFRGYLFERLGTLFGRSPPANILTLLLATALFGSLHYQQGVAGVVNATITGLVIGTIYLLNGRRLWTLMVAHASFDLAAAAMIYLNLETRVAHLVFH
jgi:hypothetical protein